MKVIPLRRPQTTSHMGMPTARKVITTSTGEEPNGKRKAGIKMNMGTGIRYTVRSNQSEISKSFLTNFLLIWQ